MSDLRTLIEYLNPKKQGGSGSGGYEYHYIRIDEEFLIENQDINSDKVHRVIEYKIESPLSSQFTKISIASNLVVVLNSGELKYYLQKVIEGKTKYLSFYNLRIGNTEDHFFEELTNVSVVPIIESDSFYYHKHQDAIYIQNIRLADAVVNFRRSLYYDPKQLGGLKNGTYYLEYKDSKGYSGSFIESVMGDVVREIDFVSNMSKREVSIELNPKKGNLKWYPDKVINQNNQVTLFYDYHPTENDDFEVDPLKEDFGIKLTFKDIEGFLGFMVITYFNNGVSILNTTQGTNKYNFCKKYIDIIYLLLNRSENNAQKALSYLYYVPLEVFEKEINKYRNPKNNETAVLGANYLWKVIGVALEGLLTNFGVNNEDIVLKLLHAVKITQNDAEYQSKEKNDEILNTLLTRKTSAKNSYLLTLYALLNTNSFVKFNTYIYLLWRTSSFTNPHNKVFSKTSQLVNTNSKNTPQLVLPYKTKELIGFYSSNMNIEFTNQETIVVTPNESAITNVLKVITPDLGEIIENIVEDDWKAEYHPLQPVFVADASKDKAIEVQRLSPMLLLKANEDKSFWINMATATEYGVDAITTLSGIGNLAKFRHLARIVKTAQALNKGKEFIRTFTVFKFVQGAIAGAEITVGTVNALLKITGIKNTKLGRAISEFLFWLELASLSGEIGAAITKGLQKSAKTIIDNVDDFEKSLDDLVRKGEVKETGKAKVIDEVYEVVEAERKLINEWDNGKLLSKRVLRKRVRGLLQEYKNFKLQINFVDETTDPLRMKDWNARNVLGSFRPGPPPKLFFRKQITELTWQHEIWHLEDLKKMGSKKFYNTPNWKKEELVWERIWKTKDKWTEEELVDSYVYYKKSCRAQMEEAKRVGDLEELLQKRYYVERYKR
ncbi:zincin-like metallopeptidase toxin domain-containing protein [Tenacibaculum sp. TC6]|uniref:zincin-like metallopeptidase toxin domain-containing protein n=1 Tax=Tenacibaculum sp. TC6 TaxID=3423223 RepID=UPI003D35E404